ncbi:hypothetical protein [Rhizobium mayense]|uniref:Lipoprotein n=1 Tax=Rhizobium mayense TaxID=1312184 RepID=A0ABT7JQ20_9HYPH|nr:hypothetical protein [Rhizobium mayense]MDL2398443.1 hypothetical protein [Rhizobium mayense]
MKLPLIASLIAVACSLSGCIHEAISHQIHDKGDDARCQSYGAKPGTEAYMNCRLTTDANRSMDRMSIAQRQMAIQGAMNSAYANVHPFTY